MKIIVYVNLSGKLKTKIKLFLSKLLFLKVFMFVQEFFRNSGLIHLGDASYIRVKVLRIPD